MFDEVITGFRLSLGGAQEFYSVTPDIATFGKAVGGGAPLSGIAGLGFIALYAYGVLPGVFAWPAGLGDIAIGVTAPWIAAALIRHPAFAASRVFAIWNGLGLLDLVVAVSTGAYASLSATGAVGEITTRPMAELPLVLIPAYFVPIFIMLHIVALAQARRAAKHAVV